MQDRFETMAESPMSFLTPEPSKCGFVGKNQPTIMRQINDSSVLGFRDQGLGETLGFSLFPQWPNWGSTSPVPALVLTTIAAISQWPGLPGDCKHNVPLAMIPSGCIPISPLKAKTLKNLIGIQLNGIQ